MKRAYFTNCVSAEIFYNAIPESYNKSLRCNVGVGGYVVTWEDDYEENYLWGY